MTDNDLLADGENIVADATGGMLVVRISRTASGARTWTVGVTAPLAGGVSADGDAALITRLLAVDDAIMAANEGQPITPPSEHIESTLTEQLRRSLVLGVLRKRTSTAVETAGSGMQTWMTSAEIVAAVGGSRGRIVADLQALVRADLVEYKPGGGRLHPSLYRLIVAGTPVVKRPKLAAVKA